MRASTCTRYALSRRAGVRDAARRDVALGHVISAGFHPTSRVGLLSHSVRLGIPAKMHPKSTRRRALFKEI